MNLGRGGGWRAVKTDSGTSHVWTDDRGAGHRHWWWRVASLASTIAVVLGVAAAATPAYGSTAVSGLPSGMRLVSSTAATLIPDGHGTTPGDCGQSDLYVDSNSKDYIIELTSYDGDISSPAWYVIYTNGIGEFTQAGGFSIDGTFAYAEGNMADPGLAPSTATAFGTVKTVEGTCAFYVVAQWTPDF
jgi:hypothetical protein